MTPQQIKHVQTTWEMVVPISDTAASLFYGRLFTLDPALRSLFKSDMKEQGRKLMQMITMVVRGLDKLDALLPAVADLGRRHTGYGVEDRHYDTVAAALLWTLEQGLADAFTSEVKDSWVAAYTTLAGAMKKAAAASPKGSVPTIDSFTQMVNPARTFRPG
jgi:hemoglobin-like flavoprotein